MEEVLEHLMGEKEHVANNQFKKFLLYKWCNGSPQNNGNIQASLLPYTVV